jgi:aquaporin Z
VAPLIGAALAAVIYGLIRTPDTIISVKQAERALPSEQRERSAVAGV